MTSASETMSAPTVIDGYSTALVVGAGILLAAAVLATRTLSRRVNDDAHAAQRPEVAKTS
ncbi:hypothetical protein [Janibacter corallicola]|uniref:hypothetical protein n=1 Tax=Janibacter corallicola TaxID=415212 RepID=UPI000A534B16|nr:hypothetical protein [Janibacter corallicola]